VASVAQLKVCPFVLVFVLAFQSDRAFVDQPQFFIFSEHKLDNFENVDAARVLVVERLAYQTRLIVGSFSWIVHPKKLFQLNLKEFYFVDEFVVIFALANFENAVMQRVFWQLGVLVIEPCLVAGMDSVEVEIFFFFVNLLVKLVFFLESEVHREGLFGYINRYIDKLVSQVSPVTPFVLLLLFR
jgi:hypothetical protein